MKPNSLASMFSDGLGNISMMRVVMILVIISVVGSKFYNAWLTKTPITWDQQDLEMAGMAFGAKLIQNTQENKPDATTSPAPAAVGTPGKPGPTVVFS